MKLKVLSLASVIAMMMLLLTPYTWGTSEDHLDLNDRAKGIEEYNYFKHFDRRENLIHLWTEWIPELQHLPEDPAIVKEGQLIRFGYEYGTWTEEQYEEGKAFIEYLNATMVFKIDGVAVDGWYWTDLYYFERWDHDGDGPGDGDGDGIGDGDPGYLSAFRYNSRLSVGEHTWYIEEPEPDGYVWIDTGTIIVLPEE